jgi:hypothetical protein
MARLLARTAVVGENEDHPWWARLLDFDADTVQYFRELPWWIWAYVAVLVALMIYMDAIRRH